MKNDEKHIELLLNLFMQGKTTLEQERELSKFFARSPSVPEKWKAYRDMFAYFDKGMPIKTKPKRNINRMLCRLVAAALLAIAIMVAPHLRHSQSSEKTIKPQSITVDNDHKTTNDTIAKPMQQQTIPFLAKQERKTSKKKTHVTAKHNLHPDSIEIEREKGEVEQAQQELMADKFIIEQERQELLDEQYYSRAQAYQAQQTLINETPQFIQVVFK